MSQLVVFGIHATRKQNRLSVSIISNFYSNSDYCYGVIKTIRFPFADQIQNHSNYIFLDFMRRMMWRTQKVYS
jgi:hypothetical protein